MRALAIALLCSAVAAKDPGADKPNIIVILADDFGHGYVSHLYPESKLRTANIDRLAKEGISFTDAHSGSALCSPTRYGLLTGRYAWRTRLVSGVLRPYDPPLIEKDRLTLPAFLRQQGYATACLGKWHLGWDWPREGKNDPDLTKPIAGGPTTRGFDYYFGTDVPNYPPYCFLENDRTVGQPTAKKVERDLDGSPGPMLPGWKVDAILPTLVDKAEAYVTDRGKDKRPFFLYFALTSPHEPIAPSGPFRGKSGVSALGDFVLETDAVVGRVMAALEKSGLADNTLLMFTGDNGSSLAGGRDLERAGHNVSAGFRGVKASIYEGGHRVPFVARWPRHIAAGTSSTETICLTDLMSTAAAILGVELPADAAEDSVSLLPALLGRDHAGPLREATVHQSGPGLLAIRQGRWKYIPGPATKPARPGGEPSGPELYDLSADPSETRNVLSERPEMAERLSALLDKYKKDGRSR